MSKYPWFPMFASDWLGSTSHALMSPEERGAYMDLLCHQWGAENCCLPDDDGILEALGGLPNGYFKGTSRVLRDCFPNHPLIGGMVANRKLLALWEGREEQRRKSSEGGKKSAQLRKEAKGTSRVLEGDLDLGCKKNPRVGQLTTTTTTTISKEAPVVPYDDIKIAWNQTKGVARIRKLTDARKRTLKTRLADPDWDWKAALEQFPLGFQGSEGRPWIPDFDFFIKADSVNKILEGKYDNGPKPTLPPGIIEGNLHETPGVQYCAAGIESAFCVPDSGLWDLAIDGRPVTPDELRSHLWKLWDAKTLINGKEWKLPRYYTEAMR